MKHFFCSLLLVLGLSSGAGARQETVDGERALEVVLSGRSLVTGELGRVKVLTCRLPDDRLIYLLFIAPERRYGELERIVNRIVSSLSLNDPALADR